MSRSTVVGPDETPDTRESTLTPHAGVDPTEKVLAKLTELGCKPRRQSTDKYRALCPAHPDVRPSLSITRTADRVLINCFATCRKDDLLALLGLEKRDLFSNYKPPAKAQAKRIVDVYPYEDDDCRPLAEKVRFEPKGFAWQRSKK